MNNAIYNREEALSTNFAIINDNITDMYHALKKITLVYVNFFKLTCYKSCPF